MYMKTIYDRLNPDILASIKNDLEKYPASTGDLVKSLKETKFWSELKMNQIQSVINHSHKSLIEISHMDIIYGDGFLTKENDDYIVSITG